jgi:hypothetical protein
MFRVKRFFVLAVIAFGCLVSDSAAATAGDCGGCGGGRARAGVFQGRVFQGGLFHGAICNGNGPLARLHDRRAGGSVAGCVTVAPAASNWVGSAPATCTTCTLPRFGGAATKP